MTSTTFQASLHQSFVTFAEQIVGPQTTLEGYRAAHPVPLEAKRRVDDAEDATGRGRHIKVTSAGWIAACLPSPVALPGPLPWSPPRLIF